MDTGQFGTIPLQSWIGKVVSFADQEDQIKGTMKGWGWRYKVRIINDYSQSDPIEDADVQYAYALLPTTAGSGGGGRIRSVRIVQGDMVFGFFAEPGRSQPLIMGVFPRTKAIDYSKKGKLAPIKGWYGNIKHDNSIVGDYEYNEAYGVKTPKIISNVDKTNRKSGAGNLSQIGVDPKGENGVDAVKDPKIKDKEVNLVEGQDLSGVSDELNGKKLGAVSDETTATKEEVEKALKKKEDDIAADETGNEKADGRNVKVNVNKKMTLAQRRAARNELENRVEQFEQENGRKITVDEYDKISSDVGLTSNLTGEYKEDVIAEKNLISDGERYRLKNHLGYTDAEIDRMEGNGKPFTKEMEEARVKKITDNEWGTTPKDDPFYDPLYDTKPGDEDYVPFSGKDAPEEFDDDGKVTQEYLDWKDLEHAMRNIRLAESLDF